MSDITLKVTVKQQLAMLAGIFIVYTAIGAAAIYFSAFKMNTALLHVFLGFFLLDGLPALLVHIQYWLTNRNTVLKIDKEYQRLTYITTNETKVYRFEDIALLQHVASYGGGSWYSFSEYRYFKITFDDKSEIVVTCLMMSNIKERLELLLGRKAEKKLRIVAFIK
jgi:hypothetical protein